MSSAAAGLPILATHPPQILALLATVFLIGLAVVVLSLFVSIFARERSSARIFTGRQLAIPDFYARPFPPARETSLVYRRGQFEERGKSFAR